MIDRILYNDARYYQALADMCWNLLGELSDGFVGYELLVDKLREAAIEFDNKFESLLSD